MSVEHRAYDNEHGDPVVVLVVTGTHDVSRLLNLMAGASPNTEQRKVAFAVRTQVRRHNGGRAAMRLLRDHGGPDFTCEAERASMSLPKCCEVHLAPWGHARPGCKQ